MKFSYLVISAFALGLLVLLAYRYLGESLSSPDEADGTGPSAAAPAVAPRVRPGSVSRDKPVPSAVGQKQAPAGAPAVIYPTESDSEHRRFKRYSKTQLKPSLRDIAKEFQKGRPARISVPLFDGDEAVVVVDEFTPYGEDAGAFSGKVEDDEGSFVIFSFSGSAESGSIRLPVRNAIYTIQPDDDSCVLIGELNGVDFGRKRIDK